MWSICLQSRDGRKVISIPSSATTQELYETALSELHGVDIQSLKGGFPPRTIPCDGTILMSTILSNQERVQVVLGTTGTSITTTANGSPKKKACLATSPIQTPTSTTTQQPQEGEAMIRKSRRAASKAATESMPALIKAQESHIKQLARETTGPNNNTKRPRTTNTSEGKNNSSSRSSLNVVQQPKRVTLSATTGPGRRLADGVVMVDIDDVRRRAAAAGRRAAASAASNTSSLNAITSGGGGKIGSSKAPGDLSEALLGALHSKGQMGIVLRKGMKNAVQASYETTRAFSRLAAIQGRSYQLTNCWSNATTNESPTATTCPSSSSNGSFLKVIYHGTVDKVKVEETVDLIPLDVLKAVIEGIYSSDTKEALRPENLSRLSPRVLWSCVYYYYDHPVTATSALHNNNTDKKSNIQDLYQHLLPHLDWTFLRRRAAQLSQKAMENQRQETEMAEQRKRRKNGGPNDDDDEDDSANMERAAQAVAAVEHAMEHLHDYQMEERKARQAQAALARLAQQQLNETGGTTRWTLTTPSEPDRDELRECIESSLPPVGPSSTSVAANTSMWISKLMKECQIHNWRELANVSDPTIIAMKLSVPEQYVQSWIDHAQNESVSEIIVQICDGNIDAVELLTETARTGTPKDLAAWRAIPELLIDQLHCRHQHGDEKHTDDVATAAINKNDVNREWMDLITISTWCNRAQQLLQEFEWLNWYATPIE